MVENENIASNTLLAEKNMISSVILKEFFNNHKIYSPFFNTVREAGRELGEQLSDRQT